MHIFFHSGAREQELLLIKKSDIDIKRQRYKVIIRKGKDYVEKWRTIKDIVLPLWQEVFELASGDQYLFSEGLNPGDKTIRRDQITRRWRTHVKQKLSITADFYSLKHSNLDEIAEALDIEAAQKAAGHTTAVITMDYAIGEKERQHQRLKKVKNVFA
jgi:integrase